MVTSDVAFLDWCDKEGAAGWGVEWLGLLQLYMMVSNVGNKL